MSESPRAAMEAEMKRTAFQKKGVSHLPPNEVLELAITFFKDRGYRSGRAGRPNQVFVMGPGEGALPRVNGEVMARPDVGKSGVTLVSIDGFGERLNTVMDEFHRELRRLRAEARAAEKSS